MARRAELFVRELSDEEAAHLLKQARRGKNAVNRHRRHAEIENASKDVNDGMALNHLPSGSSPPTAPGSRSR